MIKNNIRNLKENTMEKRWTATRKVTRTANLSTSTDSRSNINNLSTSNKHQKIRMHSLCPLPSRRGSLSRSSRATRTLQHSINTNSNFKLSKNSWIETQIGLRSNRKSTARAWGRKCNTRMRMEIWWCKSSYPMTNWVAREKVMMNLQTATKVNQTSS